MHTRFSFLSVVNCKNIVLSELVMRRKLFFIPGVSDTTAHVGGSVPNPITFFFPLFSQEDWEGDHHWFWCVWVGSSSPVAEFWDGCHSSGSQGMNFCAVLL